MTFCSKQKIYVLCETGALGDTIATFPTLKLLAERGHIEKLFIDEKYYDLYKVFFPPSMLVGFKDALGFVKPDHNVPKSCLDPATGKATILKYECKPGIRVAQTMMGNRPSPIHCHLVDCFSLRICDAVLKHDQKSYPCAQKAKLPTNKCPSDNYVVIGYGATAEHRKMTPEAFFGIREYLLGRGIDVVLLGRRDHELTIGATGEKVKPVFDGLDTRCCIDLIDKTTITESLSILRDANCFIGVDGGLMHLAGLTDIPIVGGFTTVDPEYRVITRAGLYGWRFYPVEPDSACKYCQTEHFCVTGVLFDKCHTKTFECQNSLTADKWISQITNALEGE